MNEKIKHKKYFKKTKINFFAKGWLFLFFTFTFHLSTFTLFAQQDPQYSMFMFDKMALNPAAAGSKSLPELNLVSRDQWLDIPGAPVTNALLFSSPSASSHTGWGIEVMNDNIGPTVSNSVQANYAYRIPIGNGKLSMGLGLSIYDYTFNWAEINYKDKSESAYNLSNSESTIAPSASAGLYYYTTDYYIGISVNHLIASKLTNLAIDSTATFAPHAYFIAGKAFQSASGIIWNPSVILQYAQNAPLAESINLNVMLAGRLWLGVSFKPQYGFVFLIDFIASRTLSVGYAYDLGENAIGVIGGGTHELSLSLDFGHNKGAQVSARYF